MKLRENHSLIKFPSSPDMQRQEREAKPEAAANKQSNDTYINCFTGSLSENVSTAEQPAA